MALLKSTGSKKVNLDFNKEFINTFSEKIENGNIEFINQTLKDLHEADVANLIENLNPNTRIKLIELEAFNINPEIFVELNESIQSEVLQLLSTDSIIKIIKRLESDNAIKILENLEKDTKEKVLDKLPPEMESVFHKFATQGSTTVSKPTASSAHPTSTSLRAPSSAMRLSIALPM